MRPFFVFGLKTTSKVLVLARFGDTLKEIDMLSRVCVLIAVLALLHVATPFKTSHSRIVTRRSLNMGIDVSGLKVVPIPEEMMNQLAYNTAGSGSLFDLAGRSDLYSDVQNVLILAAGISYVVYEKRPRGSAREDLVDIRRSGIAGANLGVYASDFIAQGTLLGNFPGRLMSMTDTLAKKKDEDARNSAQMYIWSISPELVLDPTNELGKLDLGIKYVNM